MYTVTVTQRNSPDTSTIFVQQPTCTIGDDDENTVTLKGRKIAKVHAQLEYRDNGIHIANRAKFKSLFVNDHKVDHFGPITVSDTILIGDFQLTITLSDIDPNNDSPIAPTTSNRAARKQAYQEWQQHVHDAVADSIPQHCQTHALASDNHTERNKIATVIKTAIQNITDLPNAIDPSKLGQRVHGEIVDFGALTPLLNTPTISEIMVNSHNEIFYEENEKTHLYNGSFTSPQVLINIIQRLVSTTGRRIDHLSPMVDARLPDGSRINAVIPPLAVKGPSLTIRKVVHERLTAQHLINFETLSPEMMKFLEVAVTHKCNIIIAGSTGSGKSTLLNVLSSFIPNKERVIVIEDAAELELSQPNLVSLEARQPDIDGTGAIEIRDLVKNSLRMNPDRIVVGECRGGEAIDMLQAMNTGHNGSLTTIHANSPRDCISRLEVLSLMSGVDIPIIATRTQIASSIDIIIQQTRFPCGSRRVTSISEVSGMESGNVQLGEIFSFQQQGVNDRGKTTGQFTSTGFIPTFYEHLREHGIATDLSIFQ